MSTANKAERRANKYFSANKKESDAIRSQLAEYGITEAELLARSAQNNSDAILMFEGMVSSRERSRRKLQKEMRKRRPSQGVKSEAHGDVNAGRQDRHGPCQEVNAAANDDFDAHHHGQPRPSHELRGASSSEVGVHQSSQLGSCQEAKAKLVGESGVHHHGH